MMRVLCVLLSLSFAGLQDARASNDQLVVMVEATFGESSTRERGAGIIVEESPERTIIVTALHVVESAEGGKASDISVEFSSLRGQSFKASTNGFYADPSIDLAVLFVQRSAVQVRPPVFTASDHDAISPTLPEALAGSRVEIVGAMRRQRWATGTEEDRVVSGNSAGLQISSSEAGAGASGSAVFDTLGRLLGMGTHIDSATGHLVAVPMGMIVNKLAGWKISVGLTTAEAGTTSAEISSRFNKELQILSTYVPSRDPDNFSTTFRLAAQMTPLLRSLSPQKIEVSYSRWYPEVVTTAVLLPPAFSTEHNASVRKENAQAWVVIADGRRLGPFPLNLDFESDPIAAIRRMEPRFGTKVVSRTLEIVQLNLEIEKSNDLHNAIAQRKRAADERTARERDATATAEDFTEVRESFHEWDAVCRRKRESAWECDYPLFITQTRLRALRFVEIGASGTNLSVRLPVDDIEVFRPAFAEQAAKLLNDHPEMTALYIRAQPAKGDPLGPKALCRVSIHKNTSKGYCNDW